ncbi:MAG: hypothetical protein AAFY71_23675 [Bacteroidota bacterium]
MTADLGFILLSISLFLFLLVSGRKEIPLVLICHALVQYGFTMTMWMFNLSGSLGNILMIYLWLTSIMLIWGRGLRIGGDLFSIRLFFSVSQWAVLIVLLLFIFLKTPYYYIFPTNSGGGPFVDRQITFHPVLKLSGNILIFSTIFQVVLHWGQRWKFIRSVLDVGPMIIYLVILIYLKFFRLDMLSQPMT